MCPSFTEAAADIPNVMISLDGVSETKSTTTSLDVYSSKLRNCRSKYPHRIVRPLQKFKVDNGHEFSTFLNDLISNDCEVTDFVGDNPKRSFARESLNHASYYACEYCNAKAVQFKDIDKNNVSNKDFESQSADIKKIQLLQNTPGTSASKQLDEQKIQLLLSPRQ